MFLACSGLLGSLAEDWTQRMQNANALHEQRRFREADAAYRGAIAEAEALGPADWRYAQALNNYAAHLAETGQHSRAEEYYQRALVAFNATSQPEQLGIATCNLAVLYRTTGRYTLGAATAEEGIRVLASLSPSGSPFLATCWNNAAEAYRNAGEFQKAEDAARRSADMAAAVLGPRDVRVSNAYHTLGNILQVTDRAGAAVNWYAKALEIREAVLGREHPFVAATLSSLASAFIRENRYPDAERYATRAVQVTEAAYGSDHGQLLGPLNNLAQVYRLQGRHREAEPVFRRALKISEAWFGVSHPDHAKVLANFAEYLDDRERHRAAAELYEKAAKTLLGALGQDHPSVATVHLSLARVYLHMGRKTEAEALYRRWQPATLSAGSRPVQPPR